MFLKIFLGKLPNCPHLVAGLPLYTQFLINMPTTTEENQISGRENVPKIAKLLQH